MKNNISNNNIMDLEKILKNKYVYGGLVLLLVVYVQSAKLTFDPKISRVINSNLFRLIVLSLIAYLSTQDITVSLILSLGFVILMVLFQNQKLMENFKGTNKIMDLDRQENNPLPQPGLQNKLRCDPVNPATNSSFTDPIGCTPYSDEATEYNL